MLIVKKLVVIISMIALSACSNISSVGEKMGDSVVDFSMKHYVGKDYQIESQRTRLTSDLIPTRVPTLGKKISQEKLASGNSKIFL